MELQWPLILFTTFGAWSAGTFAAQCLYLLRGEGKRAQMPALITSVVLLVLGGIAVFFHLEHWERIFNGFGHISSGITHELIAIVLLGLVMVVYFVYLKRSENAKTDPDVPKWLLYGGIAMSAILVCVMGHAYMMPSRPTWDLVLQAASLIGAACAFGPATMSVICTLREDKAELNVQANIIGQIANAALLVIFLIGMQFASSNIEQVAYWFDPTSPTQRIAGTGNTEPFAGASLSVAIISILAALAGVGSVFMAKNKGDKADWKVWGVVGVSCVLVSAVALRAVFYMTGVSIFPFF